MGTISNAAVEAFLWPSRHDEDSGVHTDGRVRLAIIGERARGVHGEHLRCSTVGDRNEWAARCRCDHGANDCATNGRMASEVAIEGEDGAHLDLDALGCIREVTIGEGDGRRRGHSIVCRGRDVATIDACYAQAAITHAAHAIGVVGARVTIGACRTGPTTAIGVGFASVLDHVRTARRSAGVCHGIAEAA